MQDSPGGLLTVWSTGSTDPTAVKSACIFIREASSFLFPSKMALLIWGFLASHGSCSGTDHELHPEPGKFRSLQQM